MPLRDSRLSESRTHIVLKGLFALGLLLVADLLYPTRAAGPRFEPGKPAPVSVYAQSRVEIDKSPDELAAEAEEVRARIPPVLTYDEGAKEELSARYSELASALRSDSGRVEEISAESWAALKTYPHLATMARDMALSAQSGGIVEELSALAPARSYSVVRGETEVVTQATELHDRESELRQMWNFALSRYGDTTLAIAFTAVAGYLLVPNITYDRLVTESRVETAVGAIPRVKELIDKGEPVVLAGEIVTPATLEKLRIVKSSEGRGWSHRWGVRAMLLLVFLFAVLFFGFHRGSLPNWAALLAVGMGTVLTLLLAYMGRNLGLSPHISLIPFFALLVAMLLDRGSALFLTLLLSAVVAIFYDMNMHLFLFGLAIGGSAALSSKSFRTRYQLYLAAFYVLLAGGVFLAADGLLTSEGWLATLKETGWTGLSALGSVLLAFIVLPIFEKLFRTTTDFLLLELANLNHPLLIELSEKAPGTFAHSVLVGNLCEAAARAVGANALLARVGMYYHDIGKIENPEYFIENQKGKNPHDSLSPEESVKILKAHVRAGYERLKKAGLPNEVARFALTHQGTALMKYFYTRAKANDQLAEEADFRYEGPKPRTREEAIGMLADGVEAASKAASGVSEAKVRELVKSFIDERQEDGQLDEAHLTQHELSRIESAFLPVVLGAVHQRVQYPAMPQDT